MRPHRHPARRTRRGPAGIAAWGPVTVAAALAVGLLTTTPAAYGAVRFAARLVDAARTLSRHAPQAPGYLRDARLFGGTPAVGALFTVSGGRLGGHFCTASVVDSPHKDLLITAAHCVSKLSPGQIAFVPAYHRGLRPYGIWLVTKVFVDSAWRRSANPNDDFAFLAVHRPGSRAPIQDVTGGDRLGIGWPARERVRVIGYPDGRDQPVTCQGRTRPFGTSQMRFDCGGYTDGTSGGPFLARVSRGTREGTVIGVIGGYEQGGDLASVSYSARFGTAARSLYAAAVAHG